MESYSIGYFTHFIWLYIFVVMLETPIIGIKLFSFYKKRKLKKNIGMSMSRNITDFLILLILLYKIKKQKILDDMWSPFFNMITLSDWISKKIKNKKKTLKKQTKSI